MRTCICIAACLLASLAIGAAPAPTTRPASPSRPKPKSSLDYWLGKARPAAATRAATAPAERGANPFGGRDRPFRPDALPGVIELSNEKQLPGRVYTTLEKPWLVWVEQERRWRRIPFITVLSITAVVVEEKMSLKWRWKGMGEPERVYSGTKFPMRRFLWKFRLIDGGEIIGAVKGQPIWVRREGKTTGPMVLHERSKGEPGRTLKELVYIRKVVISRKMRDAVLADQAKGTGGRETGTPKREGEGRS